MVALSATIAFLLGLTLVDCAIIRGHGILHLSSTPTAKIAISYGGNISPAFW